VIFTSRCDLYVTLLATGTRVAHMLAT
jgi:hypothetical protein